jgi:hypothetical protein
VEPADTSYHPKQTVSKEVREKDDPRPCSYLVGRTCPWLTSPRQRNALPAFRLCFIDDAMSDSNPERRPRVNARMWPYGETRSAIMTDELALRRYSGVMTHEILSQIYTIVATYERVRLARAHLKWKSGQQVTDQARDRDPTRRHRVQVIPALFLSLSEFLWCSQLPKLPFSRISRGMHMGALHAGRGLLFGAGQRR